MVTPGPDQPSEGHEYPPLENVPPPPDAYAPVDFPTDPGQRPPAYPGPYDPPAGLPPSGYPQPSYQQPGYPPPGYPPPALPGAPYPGAYPGGYAAYDPYRPPQSVGTNGKAIASLVTSVAGLLFCGLPSIVGLILGVIAMRETKRTGQEGHGLALAGVIVGALAIAGWVLYVVVILFFVAVSANAPYGY